MINKDLLTYMESEISKGTPKNVIQSNLLSNGWNEKDIAEGLSSVVVKNYNPTIPSSSINVNVKQQNIVQPTMSPSSALAQQDFQRMSVSQTQPKRTISFFKKLIIVILSIFVLVWLGFEVVNYNEYLSVKNVWDKTPRDCPPGMPCWGPIYQPIIVQDFYKIFPFLNRSNGMAYKPVIYLYPTSIEKVQVKLDYKGMIVADYPTYDVLQKGWVVTASPDGKIISSDGKEYSYLFWEGKPFVKTDYDLSTGFIVRGEDTIDFLQSTLSRMGLTPREYNEFIVYWYPRMKDNKYNLIHFAGDEYTKTAPLIIVPKPDSMLRVFMVYKPLGQIIDIKPQEIKPFVRKGFTVIEWGGTNL
jgi:hypothetical protein